MTNLLRNGSFESGWYHPDNIPEIQCPNQWSFEWEGPNTPNPIAPEWPFARPEVRVLSKAQLPESEWAGFILEGQQTLKIFRGYGAWWGRLVQRFETLPHGLYKLTVNIIDDIYTGVAGGAKEPAPDPLSGQVRFLINGHAIRFIPTQRLCLNTFKYAFQAGGLATIKVDFLLPHPVANACYFVDDWHLELIGAASDECRGAPREQYKRTYILMPQGLGPDWWHAAARGTAGKENTIGSSADDAGIGDLDNREIIAVNPHLIGSGLGQSWYDEYYPGAKMAAVTADTPAQLEIALKSIDNPGPPLPPPPPPPAKPFTVLTTHNQTEVGYWLNFIAELHIAGKPLKWVKLVDIGMENAPKIKAVSPSTKVIFRKVVQHNAPYLDAADKKKAAAQFLDAFWGSVMPNGIDAVESLNETIATHDYSGIQKAVAFDVAFAQVVADRSGGLVKPGLLTAGVGNPDHGAEVEWLLPAAEAAVKCGGYLCGHTYIPCNAELSDSKQMGWLANEGLHYHMRPLLSWDPVFQAKAGLHPKYIFGETGACYSPIRSEDGRPGGMPDALAGWRDSRTLHGDLYFYISLLVQYEKMLATWNAVNGNRCEGAAIFTSGIGVGWGMFLFNEAELKALLPVLKAL